MDTRALYESTFKDLTIQVKKTIDEFSLAHATLDDIHATPLFFVTEKIGLLSDIRHFSNYQIKDACKRLCVYISKKYAQDVRQTPEIPNVDFCISKHGKKVGYQVSFAPEFMLDLEEAKKNNITRLYVIVLQNELCLFPPNSTKYKNDPYKDMIKNISLKAFYDKFDAAEFDILQEYIGRYNYDAEMLLGLKISAIPTKRAIEKKKEEVSSRLLSDFYDSELKTLIPDNEILYLKQRFKEKGIAQVREAEFANSFVGSEWYYDLLVKTDGEIEQTAIVAGYLKSIEQLLFSILLSLCDREEFTLKEKTSQTYIRLTKDNQHDLLTMAGSLLNCIDYRNNKTKVYEDTRIGGIVQHYLHEYVKGTRNGYFHRDNIYEFSEITQIRKKSYCAFFLIGSAFKYDIEELAHRDE